MGSAGTVINGGGITYKNSYKSWDDIINGATSTTKTAVFG